VNGFNTLNLNYENFVTVNPSPIHGKGIFTTVDIPAGSEIMLINGEVISEEECIRREDEGNVYIFWNEDSYIDTFDTEKIKYINHKCDFNCEVLEADNNGLKLAAYRDIFAGEELTIDYGYDEIYEACRCALCA
jgi:uncharacterized protein